MPLHSPPRTTSTNLPQTDCDLLLDDVANEHILQIDNIPKSVPAYLALKRIIGKTSMVAIGGNHWKRVRKMFNPAFAPSHLDTLIPAIVEESMVFVDKLKSVAGNGEVVKMNELTTVKNPYLSLSFFLVLLLSLPLFFSRVMRSFLLIFVCTGFRRGY